MNQGIIASHHFYLSDKLYINVHTVYLFTYTLYMQCIYASFSMKLILTVSFMIFFKFHFCKYIFTWLIAIDNTNITQYYIYIQFQQLQQAMLENTFFSVTLHFANSQNVLIRILSIHYFSLSGYAWRKGGHSGQWIFEIHLIMPPTHHTCLVWKI